MRARVIFYDENTGEVLQEVDRAIFIGKKAFIRDRNFVKVFVGFLSDIIEDREMGTGAWKLLLYAINSMDFNNLKVYLIPEEATRELGISRETFYRWLRILLKKGYIERVARYTYRIKPYTAIKGYMELATKEEPDF
jgi:hypothetical protein